MNAPTTIAEPDYVPFVCPPHLKRQAAAEWKALDGETGKQAAARHLREMSPERRAELNAEWEA